MNEAVAGAGGITAAKYCNGCGKTIHQTARACPSCGAPQAGSSGKSRIAAGVLALFLGGIGIHKFYLGKPLLGLLYLVFCWTFIPGIIAFIEAIIYFCSSDEAFQRKYG